MQGHLLHAYPPNARRPRFNRTVKPTLSKTLTTIQNRQPLPNERCSSGCHLRFEHHVLCYLFQVAYDLRLTSGACVFQGFHQPRQRCLLGIRSRLQLLHLHGLSLVMAAHPVYCRTTVCMCVWATYFGPISSDTSPRAFTAAPISGMTSVVTGAHILLSLSPLPRYGHRLWLPRPYLCRTPQTTPV